MTQHQADATLDAMIAGATTPDDAVIVMVSDAPPPPFTGRSADIDRTTLSAAVAEVSGSDPDGWLAQPMPWPTDAASVASLLRQALDAYEWARGNAAVAADRYYACDESGDTIKADAFKALTGRSIAATPAEKMVKAEPSVLAWQEERSALARLRSEADVWLSIARRRHDTLLRLLTIYSPGV